MILPELSAFGRFAVLLSAAGQVIHVFGASNSDAKRQTNVPSFVLDYAPIAYLDTEEKYLPSDLGQQLIHTTPKTNNQTVAGAPNPFTLDNLNQLNALNGSSIYLTSDEGIEALPPWFNGIKPDATGKVSGGTTMAVVVAEKGDHVDAFYFYFYAYNEGNVVDIAGAISLGEFGDHVGDWEHTMVRFENSKPQAIWLSQHSYGEAFTYSAMEKYNGGVRPVIYIARGTHSNWGTSGLHDHTLGIDLPFDILLTDQTSKGSLYDPIESAYFYTYNITTGQFASYDGTSPTGWLYFTGLWGDAQLPDKYPGQKILFGQAKYSGGPTGPEDKNINRTSVCNGNDSTCIISPILTI